MPLELRINTGMKWLLNFYRLWDYIKAPFITNVETEKLQGMKNDKATGPDNVKNEICKCILDDQQ